MPFKIIAERTSSKITRVRGFAVSSQEKIDSRFLEMQSLRLYNIGLWINVKNSDAISRFQTMQDRIRAIIGNDHFYTPEDEFHITMAVFIDKEDDVPSQEFEDRREKDLVSYERALMDAKLMPIKLRFKGVMITENAVCLINDDDDALSSVRSRIGGAVRARGLSYHGAPNIVHTTLVRFLNPVSLEQRRAIWELFKEFQTEEFSVVDFVLAHLTTFGRFNSRTVSRIIGTTN